MLQPLLCLVQFSVNAVLPNVVHCTRRETEQCWSMMPKTRGGVMMMMMLAGEGHSDDDEARDTLLVRSGWVLPQKPFLPQQHECPETRKLTRLTFRKKLFLSNQDLNSE